MRFAFTEEQDAMRRATRAFLASASSSKEVRRAVDLPRGYDEAHFAKATGELGWAMLPFAEAHGGVGLSWLEVGIVMEEIGRALFPSPYFASVCLAGQAIDELGTDEQKQRWLAPIAAGERTATLAWGPVDTWSSTGVAATYTEGAYGYELSLSLPYVPDAAHADTFVVAARSNTAAGVALFVVPADAPGLTRTPRKTLDLVSRFGDLTLDRVKLANDARLGAGDATNALDRVLARAMAMLACEQAGAAEACLDQAVEYAKTRHQFGKPIGSFQAIKHMLADVLVSVEMAKSSAYEAAFAASSDGPSLALSATRAKTQASVAFSHAAGQNIQAHGGVGFTWEYDAHLYFKHAQQTESLLGSPSALRDAYAALLGIGQ